MHLQPLFSSCERIGGEVAEDLFQPGICLPSSSSLTLEDQMYVVNSDSARCGRPPIDSFPVAHSFTVPTVADAFVCFLGSSCVSRFTTFQIRVLRSFGTVSACFSRARIVPHALNAFYSPSPRRGAFFLRFDFHVPPVYSQHLLIG